MSKRKGAADVLADVDESKKAKPDFPNGESTEDKPDSAIVESTEDKPDSAIGASTEDKPDSAIVESTEDKPDSAIVESTEDKPDSPNGESMEAETSDSGYMQIIITGPQKCGKSCLVLSYVNELFPPRNAEFLSKQYLHILPENNQEVMIWDLDARNEFIRYRHQSYKEADVALLCFDVKIPEDSQEGSEHRLANLLHPWIAELDYNCDNIPIILVGLKRDLKFNRELNFFSGDVIKKVMKKYPRIVSYKEVSAYIDTNAVKELFTSAIACITQPKPKIMFQNCGFEIVNNRWLL